MARIESYVKATSPISGADKLIGTDSANNNETKNFTIQEISDFVGLGPYKVYTALLTQSGGDDVQAIGSDDIQPLVIGVTYTIESNVGDADFTNVGASNNDVGTSFVATGTTPNSWGTPGDNVINYNTGAPVVTVLNNTIGYIWFTFNGDGQYSVFSDDLFTLNKTFITIGSAAEGAVNGTFNSATPATTSYMYIQSAVTSTITPVNDNLSNTSFEIRIYN
jgi:hypothetical protein